ncbi:hypothetical protein [Endozoicomonas sp. Mp262]|uniref:hypothetical protein n=1 Tax=Endozoicomonas sp. Mp262 TaxID=2919499 RepID=UPI0021DAB67B
MNRSKYEISNYISLIIFIAFTLSLQNSWAGKNKPQATRYEKETKTTMSKSRSFINWVTDRVRKKQRSTVRAQTLSDLSASDGFSAGNAPTHPDQNIYHELIFRVNTSPDIRASWDALNSNSSYESYRDNRNSYTSTTFRAGTSKSKSLDDLDSEQQPDISVIDWSSRYDSTMTLQDSSSVMLEETNLMDSVIDVIPPPTPRFAQQEIYLRTHLMQLGKIKEMQQELISNIVNTSEHKGYRSPILLNKTECMKHEEENLLAFQKLFFDEYDKFSANDKLLTISDEERTCHYSFVIVILVLWIDSFNKIFQPVNLVEGRFHIVSDFLCQLNTLWRHSFKRITTQIAILCNLEPGLAIDFSMVLTKAGPLSPDKKLINVARYTDTRKIMLQALFDHIAKCDQDVYVLTTEGIHFTVAVGV